MRPVVITNNIKETFAPLIQIFITFESKINFVNIFSDKSGASTRELFKQKTTHKGAVGAPRAVLAIFFASIRRSEKLAALSKCTEVHKDLPTIEVYFQYHHQWTLLLHWTRSQHQVILLKEHN